jgi:predicted dehydrogenase
MSKNISVAIVGVGYWGPNLLRNFFQLDNVDVPVVCDLKEENLEKIKKSYPNIKYTQNYEDLLNDSNIDAIIISTPVNTHYDLAKKALLNKKHVLLEKPMTETSEEAEDLIKIAKENNLILMIDHTFLYTAAVQKIKDIVSSGDLGDLFYFSSQRLNLGLIREDVDVAWDLATHDISIMNYIINEDIEKVFATGSKHLNKEKREMIQVILRFKNGTSAYIYVSWLSPLKIRQTLIGGSKKMVLYDDVEPIEKIKVYDKGITFEDDTEDAFHPKYRDGDIYIPKLDNKEALKSECEHFLDCILNNKKPMTDGESGLKVVRVLEAIDESLDKNLEVDI